MLRTHQPPVPRRAAPVSSVALAPLVARGEAEAPRTRGISALENRYGSRQSSTAAQSRRGSPPSPSSPPPLNGRSGAKIRTGSAAAAFFRVLHFRRSRRGVVVVMRLFSVVIFRVLGGKPVQVLNVNDLSSIGF